ncbi:MAG: 5-(carboxyamino)imidazole ribonucleotide mutase [Fimbriimonas ginsengisoli]|uniref:N5-carboxyaminoimidazole ribonucleotide mutase n=1 Tax=Fimbriimonas ginsengisoli TaxID=1005039 RepID=A0A931LXG5_FIMGI|nr:5-(carboxyamino)imidazole ribonucleotide mutase [Fimbriimonas ginsengisoli]
MVEPIVGVIMGSKSDIETMRPAADVLSEFGVPHELRVVSAHRAPEATADYASGARARGLKVIIAGAGGAAALPGMVAAYTTLPVIGVPVPTKALGGVDSLHSIVQMPPGIPVATVAIGGGRNAGLLAVRILAMSDPALAAKLESYREELRLAVQKMNEELSGALG